MNNSKKEMENIEFMSNAESSEILNKIRNETKRAVKLMSDAESSEMIQKIRVETKERSGKNNKSKKAKKKKEEKRRNGLIELVNNPLKPEERLKQSLMGHETSRQLIDHENEDEPVRERVRRKDLSISEDPRPLSIASPTPSDFKISNDKEKDKDQRIMKKKKDTFLSGAINPTLILLYIKLAINDYSKRKFLFCAGVGTIILCITTTILSSGLVEKTPIIFYKTVAEKTGEVDLQIYPKAGHTLKVKAPLLNFTRIKTLLEAEFPHPRLSPRYHDYFYISNRLRSRDKLQKKGKGVFKGTFFLLDLENEIKMGIKGNESMNLAQIDPGDAWITRSLANILDLEVNDTVYVAFGGREISSIILEGFYHQVGKVKHTSLKFLLEIPFRVAGITRRFTGRIERRGEYNSMVLTDFKSFSQHLSKSIDKTYPESEYADFNKYLKTIKWEEFSKNVIFNFETRDRLYLEANYETLLKKAIPIVNKVTLAVGEFTINLRLPLIEALKFTKYANAFIGMVLDLILLGLLVIAIFVIYNIMLISIDSKVYESAVQRTIGLTRTDLLALMMTNSLGYSTTALVVGLPLCFLFLLLINLILHWIQAGFTIDLRLSGVITAIFLAILIPVISSLLPILTLLKKNISLALDKDHSKTSSLKITVKDQSEKFPWTSFLIAVGSTLIGISIYFFLPLALLSGTVTLFVLIFFGLLLCLLLGLMMVLINFTYLFEAFLMIPLYLEKKFVRMMVRMNLITHRIKNRRSVIIYSISLSLINFMYVVITMQKEAAVSTVLRGRGGEITLMRNDYACYFSIRHWNTILDKGDFGHLIDYSLVFEEMDMCLPRNSYGNFTLLSRGKLRRIYNNILAVSPNYKDVAYTELNTVRDNGIENITSLDQVQYMYTGKRPGGVIMSKSVTGHFKINCQNPDDGTIFEVVYNNSKVINKEFSCLAAFKAFSGFRVSEIPLLAKRGELVMSFPDYISTYNDTYAYNLDHMKLRKVLIKLKNSSDVRTHRKIVEKLQIFSPKYGLRVKSHEELKQQYRKTDVVLDVFFYFIIVLTMSLSQFSLISSMASNILEQKKEFAVMRCIGLTRWRIARIYLYESVIVVMTGGMIGVSVGFMVGSTIVAQNAFFSNSLVVIHFPWNLLLMVLLVSLVGSVFAAMIPAYKSLNVGITKLIKEG